MRHGRKSAAVCIVPSIFCFTALSITFPMNANAQTYAVKGVVATPTMPVRYASVTFVDRSDSTKKVSVLTNTSGRYSIGLATSVDVTDAEPAEFELQQDYPNPFNPTTVPALKDVFAKDFTIGCLLSCRNIGFATDPYVTGQSAVITPNGGSLIKFHINCMSPGNNMKPQYTVDLTGSAAAYNSAATSQAEDSIDTHPIIRFNGDLIAQLNWAKRQGFTFRGHTLVWHSQYLPFSYPL